MVLFWRGTWDYSNVWLDEYLCEGDLILSNTLAISVGFVATLVIDFWSHEWRRLSSKSGKSSDIILRYVFSIVWGLTDIMYWKVISLS